MAAGNSYCLGIKSNDFFLKDNKKAFILWLNVPKVTAYNVGMSSTRIWVHDSVSVGDNVKFGACVMVTDTDSHPVDYMARRCSNEGTKSKPVTIEDDVWIGAHSIILKGVTIGARSIIGAGSVVTKSIPADCIAAGNPCKIIKNI